MRINTILKRITVLALAAAVITMMSATLTWAATTTSSASNAIKNQYVISSDHSLKAIRLPSHVKSITYAGSHIALIKLTDTKYLGTVKKSLKSQISDLAIQPNYKYHTCSSTNDPGYSQQWGLQSDSTYGVNFESGSTFLADKTSSMSNTVVAVIDTGFDFTHEDLQGNVWTNSGEIAGNGIDDDNNGYIDDVYGFNFSGIKALSQTPTSTEYDHGTHCAGTIAATTNNGIGISGITSASGKVKIMDVKVLDRSGAGSSFSIVAGIKYAEKNGATVCNMSLGSAAPDDLIGNAIKASKMLFVCAAGNSYNDNDNSGFYPTSYPYSNILSVANMNVYGRLSATSNYGKTSVDLAAPGAGVYSLAAGNKYEKMTGTSMAAPFVTGVAALAHSYYPGITASELRQLITNNTTANSELTAFTVSGGFLNEYKVLTAKDQNYYLTNYTTAISLSATSKTLKVGKSYTLKATLTPSSKQGTPLTYKSSRKNVATVTSKGKVTAKEKGTATITVTTANNYSATCKITVK